MENLISLKELLKSAKKENIDLGKGDPYNRLRYYTKMGWIPHMTRKSTDKGDVEGHYPIWTLDILKKIQGLKNEGLTNEQIDEKIKVQNSIQKTINILGDTHNRKRFSLYAIALILVLILLTELNIINLNESKTVTNNINTDITSITIKDRGTGIVLKDSKETFVKVNSIGATSKVNVTFTNDYFPATRYWVKNIQTNKGFYLETDMPVGNTVTFSWFVSN